MLASRIITTSTEYVMRWIHVRGWDTVGNKRRLQKEHENRKQPNRKEKDIRIVRAAILRRSSRISIPRLMDSLISSSSAEFGAYTVLKCSFLTSTHQRKRFWKWEFGEDKIQGIPPLRLYRLHHTHGNGHLGQSTLYFHRGTVKRHGCIKRGLKRCTNSSFFLQRGRQQGPGEAVCVDKLLFSHWERCP